MFDFLKKNRNNQSTPSDNTDCQQKPLYMVSELGKARYIFEHQVLKGQFFTDTKLFIDVRRRKMLS